MFKIIAILVVMMPALARAQDAPCVSPLAAPSSFVAVAVDKSVDSALGVAGARNLPERIAALSIRAQSQVRSLSEVLQLSPAEIGGYYVAAVCRRLLARGQSGERLKASVAPLALALKAPLPSLPGDASASVPLESPPPFFAEPSPPSPSSQAAAPARDTASRSGDIAFEPPLALPPSSSTASATDAGHAAEASQDETGRKKAAAKRADLTPRKSAGAELMAKQQPVTVGDAAGNKMTIAIDLGGVPDHHARADALAGEECEALGGPGRCAEVAAVIKKLRQKPIEYNHPRNMLLGRKTHVSLVLRGDWQAAAGDAAGDLKGLPGTVEKGTSKVTPVMSARLAGGAFDVRPNGAQERPVTTGAATVWTWIVTPSRTGKAQPLKLELYAHIQAGGENKPPVLIKTLDATIDVDVAAWDWLITRARAIEPVYGILAIVAGLAMALFVLYRRTAERRQQPAGPGRRYLGTYPDDEPQ